MPRRASATKEPGTSAAPATSVAAGNGSKPTELQSFNPATGELLGTVPISTAEDVRKAVERAREAQKAWGKLAPKNRAAYIFRIREKLLARAEEACELLVKENGKTRQEAAMAEVMPLADLMTFFGKRAPKVLRPQRISMHLLKTRSSYVHFEPRGVVGVIAPWNFPLNIPMGQVIMALLAGNAVILKPSEWTPLTAKWFKELTDSAGLPAGLFQVVQGYGDVGSALIEAQPNYLGFTGSVAVGKIIGSECGKRLIPCSLELGGKAPLIVCEDANLERVTNAAVWGGFCNSGQICVSVERIYVHERIHDEFVAKVREKTKRLRQGYGLGDDVDIGAVCFPKQIDIAERLIADAVAKGAKIETGGKRREGVGQFFEPTVLSGVTHEMDVINQEIFGPVLPIVKVKTEEEAVRLANSSHLGLAAYVFSNDRAKALRIADQVEAGSVEVNDVLLSYALPEVPFGGVKESGIGVTHSVKGLRDLCQRRHVNYNQLLPLQAREMFWYPYSTKTYNMLLKTMRFLFRW